MCAWDDCGPNTLAYLARTPPQLNGPTTIKKIGEHWYAQRREDFQWILIPEGKLEHNQPDPRESPDYQSHVCMTLPGSGKTVYCAVLGSRI
jgi:hypothetical protein